MPQNAFQGPPDLVRGGSRTCSEAITRKKNPPVRVLVKSIVGATCIRNTRYSDGERNSEYGRPPRGMGPSLFIDRIIYKREWMRRLKGGWWGVQGVPGLAPMALVGQAPPHTGRGASMRPEHWIRTTHSCDHGSDVR